MLFAKKFIHIFWKKNLIQNHLILLPSPLTTFYFNNNNTLKSCNYFSIYKLFFFIKTKHLFLFTIYLIYTKLLNKFRIFDFHFSIFKKKTKKITILRAPCYHKNSKEQYGLNYYKGLITTKFLHLQYKFYNLFLFTFLQENHIPFITKYWYILKKNEKKYIE